MKPLPKILIALAALLSTLPAPAAAESSVGFATASGIRIVYERDSDPARSPARFLDDLDREITRFFRAPKRSGGGRIVISPRHGAGKAAYLAPDLFIGDGFLNKLEDPEFRRELAGRLLQLRFNLENAAHPPPDWITAGLFDALAARLDSESATRRSRSRHYPLIRTLLNLGMPPDFRVAMQLPGLRLTGSAREAFGEISRFLLDLAASVSDSRDNALAAYAIESMRRDGEEEVIFAGSIGRRLRALRGEQGGTAEELIRQLAPALAFNRTFPPSPERLQTAWEKACTARFELPDRDGRPSGDFREIAIAGLPAFFAVDPTAGELVRRQFEANFDGLLPFFPTDLVAELNLMQQEVRQFRGGRSPEAAAARFDGIRRGVTEKLRRQAAIEEFLDRAERRHVSAFRLFRRELSELFTDHDFLSGGGTAFLEEVEARYLE